MIPRKIHEKSETVINTCVSIINQHQKKMAEILQERGFLTWGIQTFVRKVKQFVRKYITWLITKFVVIDIPLLVVQLMVHRLRFNLIACTLTCGYLH